MPSIDVHVTGRSIRFGCGVFRSQVDASNCSPVLFISLFFCVVKTNSCCWQTNVIQCGCLAIWFMSTGFQNYVSIQGFPAAYCTFIFLFLWERLPVRAAINSCDVVKPAISSASCTWTDHCLEFLLGFFCSDNASVLHLCCVFFHMSGCQPQSGSYDKYNP